jgi:hypothetical protein
MYAQIESVQLGRRPRMDPRLLGASLAAALAMGVVAGYLAATLTAQKPSTVLKQAPAATVSAPSTGIYGDRDSRLPIANITGHSGGVYGDHDSRLPIGSGAGLDRAALNLGVAANVTALRGMAAVDWTKVAGDANGGRDSRPPLAPYNKH